MREALAVVRTQGERTEALAIARAQAQFGRVEVVRAQPLVAAVAECFRLAIAAGTRWLVTVDADVLVADDCADGLAASAQALLYGGGWQALGLCDDKLVGGPRRGGVRLYRVEVLPQRLGQLRDTVRPEGDLARRFGYLPTQQVTGQHDYEQWYRDLYRKGAQHRAKHASWARTVVPRWRRSMDPDLRAALAGWDGEPFEMAEKAPL